MPATTTTITTSDARKARERLRSRISRRDEPGLPGAVHAATA